MTDHRPEPEGDAEAAEGIGPGALLGDYRVLRLLGQGGMGEVYLCRDVRLGRKVALKVVRQDLLGDAKGQQRFLQEARLTARFNHPHIVTVFGVGEHEGCLYVALEYLEGSTLAERLDEGRLGLREALRIGLAIAEALTEAHSHGVLHRDLKPQNVLVPRDGRLRVLDFGLARLVSGVDTEDPPAEIDRKNVVSSEIEAMSETMEQVYKTRGKGLRGTPRYMAPEQWREESGTPETDIWALGLMLYELLAGQYPFQEGNLYKLLAQATDPEPVISIGELDPELPEALVALVDRCVSKKAEMRPTAAAVVTGLRDQLEGAARRRTERQSPYRGLLPFSERHADLFFGRDAEVGLATERLREETVLPVLGPSGAGKSSFVAAGVIPRLREGGRWVVLPMRPGSAPFEVLASRLLAGETIQTRTAVSRRSEAETLAETVEAGSEDTYGAVSGDAPTMDGTDSPPPSLSLSQSAPTAAQNEYLAAQLRASPGRLALELLRRAEAERARVLLFVDQLEELFTLVRGDDAEDEQRAFLEALCTAADDPAGPVRVIFTLRDDFLWRAATGDIAREVLGRVLVLQPPSPQRLVETLERPAARAGYHFEDAELPLEMVAEIQGEAAALPLVQFTAQMLWERRDRKRKLLTRSAYDAIGGVTGALAHHTDSVLAALTAEQERLARAIFVRLVTPESTRRVVSRAELLEGLEDGAEEVLERFTAARAILQRKGRTSTSTGGRGAELELVHESLIHNWAQLATWLDESREERVFLAEIGQAAALWLRRGRPDAEVWTGDALRDAVRRADRCEVVPEQVEEFLEAGRRRTARSASRRRLGVGLGFAVMAIVAVVALVVAGVMRRQERTAKAKSVEAQKQRKLAEERQKTALKRRAEAQREGARAALARGAFVEARAKLRSALEIEDSPLARALWWRIIRNPQLWAQPIGTWSNCVALSPDGELAAVAGADGVVHLFEIATGVQRPLRGHRDQVHAVTFSPSGRLLASGGWDGEIRLWDPKTGGLLRRWRAHQTGISMLAFDSQGGRLASASKDRTVRLWEVSKGTLQHTLRGHRGAVRDVQFSPDGQRVVSAGDDKQAVIWNPLSGTRIRSFKAPSRLLSAAFRQDGRAVATGATDGVVRLFDANTGQGLGELRGHPGRVRIVRFLPNRHWLASAGFDGEIWIWDQRRMRLFGKLPGHKLGVYSLSSDRQGAHIVSAGYDRRVRLWALSRVEPFTEQRMHRGATYGIAFSPDGRVLASSGYDGRVLLWDLKRGVPRKALRGHEKRVYAVAYQPPGRTLATVSADKTVRLWKPETGSRHRILRHHRARVYAVAYSRDGRWLATAGSDQLVRLWETSTGYTASRLAGHRSSIIGLGFDPRGRLLASASTDRTVRLWEVASRRQVALLKGHLDKVRGVVFGPEGKRLLSSSDDRTLRWWSAEGKGRLLKTWGPQDYRVYWLDIDPKGERIAAPCSDGRLRILDAATGRTVHTLRGHHDEVSVARFHPGGAIVASTSDDGTVRLWDAKKGRPLWRAPLLRSIGVELCSQNGWRSLKKGQRGPVSMTARWRRRVIEAADQAAESPDGRWLCLSTFDGHIELWDGRRDRRLLRHALAGVSRVLSLASGHCVVLAKSTVYALAVPATGQPKARRLADNVTAIGRSSGAVLVATRTKVERVGVLSSKRASWPGTSGVRSLAEIGDWVALGYKDGAIELLPRGDQPPPKFSFEDTPSSPVVRLAIGPRGTLVAGYANGVFGLWSLTTGALLFRGQLHGPVVHIVKQGPHLYVATELGQHMRLDLSVFHAPYCELMKTIWRAVPVRWVRGVAVPARPEATHHCIKK